jgi:hypothetical protein
MIDTTGLNLRTYPSSLKMYKLIYNDDTSATLFGCGAANAIAISKMKWPHLEVTDIQTLDDSWRN